jgi:hypothetical protein
MSCRVKGAAVHLGADQPLNMPAKRGAPGGRQSIHGCSRIAFGHTTAEICAIVHMHPCRETGDGPRFFDLAFFRLSMVLSLYCNGHKLVESRDGASSGQVEPTSPAGVDIHG